MQLFGNIQNELIARISEAKKSLKVAVTWFTNHDLFDAIIKKLENPEFLVSLIVLNDRINNKKEGLNFQKLINSRGKFYYSSIDNMVHHKFCIIDDSTIITGSYNWTYYAENRNWENIVVLKNDEIVKAYIKEFERLIKAHDPVEIVTAKQKMDIALNSSEYITSDYTFQAKQEENRGNDLVAAKIYTEILRINDRQPEIQKARTAIVQKINQQRFETCPFEIGIHFLNGYSKIIPAFTHLPITKKASGSDPYGNSSSLQVTIEKYDYLYTTLLQFSLDNLKPCPKDTAKIEHTLTVNTNGILTVYCAELNGFGRRKTEYVDLKKFS